MVDFGNWFHQSALTAQQKAQFSYEPDGGTRLAADEKMGDKKSSEYLTEFQRQRQALDMPYHGVQPEMIVLTVQDIATGRERLGLREIILIDRNRPFYDPASLSSILALRFYEQHLYREPGKLRGCITQLAPLDVFGRDCSWRYNAKQLITTSLGERQDAFGRHMLTLISPALRRVAETIVGKSYYEPKHPFATDNISAITESVALRFRSALPDCHACFGIADSLFGASSSKIELPKETENAPIVQVLTPSAHVLHTNNLTTLQMERRGLGLPFAGAQPETIVLSVGQSGTTRWDLCESHEVTAQHPAGTLVGVCAIHFNQHCQASQSPLRGTVFHLPAMAANGYNPRNLGVMTYTGNALQQHIRPALIPLSAQIQGNKNFTPVP